VKFYVIKGVEYATQQAINSLLKFLEEPPTDTYAILTTRAINLVLPTIKSRCQMFTFKSNFQVFDEILNKYNLDVHQKDVIKKTYYSYDDIINQLDSKVFYTIYDFANTFVHNLDNLPTIKALQEQFTKFDYKQIELVLRMLNALVSNNEKLFKLVDNVRVNPIKMLLFNNIWTILQGDK
jgi:DNA polymerase-3 subunit delta'